MTDMIWEDPPVGRRARESWDLFAAACRAHPGKWARVVAGDGRAVFGSSTANLLKRRGLEVRMTHKDDAGATLPDGRLRLWARHPEAES